MNLVIKLKKPKESESNDSSTNLTNLKPVEFESSQTDNK